MKLKPIKPMIRNMSIRVYNLLDNSITNSRWNFVKKHVSDTVRQKSGITGSFKDQIKRIIYNDFHRTY